MSRPWFRVVLVTALGLSLFVVISLFVGQLSYAGPVSPLDALGEGDVRHAIYLSLICATIATFLGIALAIPTAYALAKSDFRGKTVIDALLDIPIILSPVALGLSLLLLFRTSPGGWVQDHLIRFVFEVPGIILAQFILALALSIRVLKATFDDQDRRLEQVARFLGATPWKSFRHVALPLARPGLLAAFILSWARVMSEFGATVTIAGAVQGKTETIPVSIYLNLSSIDIDKAVALMLLLSMVALTVLLSVRLISRGQYD